MANLILILCGILGVLFHCCFKANTLKNQAAAANIKFAISDYIEKDFLSIIASFLSVAIWYLLFSEVATKYPELNNCERLSFVLMGGSGSYIIQYFFSTAEKKITSVIDKKTDEADGSGAKDTILK